MNQEELGKHMPFIFEFVARLTRRQRWELRRDIKDASRLYNVRYPEGKSPEEGVASTEAKPDANA